jgi:Protein of unknown function (DUF2849)
MPQQVITANRLLDGRVVFLAAGGEWSELVGASRVAGDDSEAALLQAEANQAVADRKVVAPYLIPVSTEGGQVTPLRYREVLRALGPSTHPEYGRPASATAAS